MDEGQQEGEEHNRLHDYDPEHTPVERGPVLPARLIRKVLAREVAIIASERVKRLVLVVRRHGCATITHTANATFIFFDSYIRWRQTA